jgi:hypothetical protein
MRKFFARLLGFGATNRHGTGSPGGRETVQAIVSRAVRANCGPWLCYRFTFPGSEYREGAWERAHEAAQTWASSPEGKATEITVEVTSTFHKSVVVLGAIPSFGNLGLSYFEDDRAPYLVVELEDLARQVARTIGLDRVQIEMFESVLAGSYQLTAIPIPDLVRLNPNG